MRIYGAETQPFALDLYRLSPLRNHPFSLFLLESFNRWGRECSWFFKFPTYYTVREMDEVSGLVSSLEWVQLWDVVWDKEGVAVG